MAPVAVVVSAVIWMVLSLQRLSYWHWYCTSLPVTESATKEETVVVAVVVVVVQV